MGTQIQAGVRFTEVVLHRAGHADEIVGLLMLKKFGEHRFPGISQATVSFCGTGGNHYLGMTGDECEKKGIILIGFGGGRFDEHPRDNTPRKLGECAASLVASFIGWRRVTGFKEFLDEVCVADLKANDHPLNLASLIKSAHRMNPGNPHEVIARVETMLQRMWEGRMERSKPVPRIPMELVREWAERQLSGEERGSKAFSRLLSLAQSSVGGLNILHIATIASYFSSEEPEYGAIDDMLSDKFADMQEFVRCEEAFDRCATWNTLLGGQGRLKLVFVKTDMEQVDKLGRNKGADVVVAFRKDGHCQIFTKKVFGADRKTVIASINLGEVIRLLRMEEQYLATGKQLTDWRKLEDQPGFIDDRWHYFPEGSMILNGSSSHPDVKPTRITPERIMRLIELALGSQFHPHYERDCQRNICAGEQCPLFAAGLWRCRNIRADRANERRARHAEPRR